MSDKTRIIKQEPDARFRVEHDGQRPDADGCVHPIQHAAQIVHEGRENAPFVHVVQMRQDEPCGVRTSGEIAHVGDPKRPVPLEMRHSSPTGPVALDLRVRGAEHDLRVHTGVQDPMHHALQLQTPVQLRFVNPWTAQSDYRLSLNLGNMRLFEVRLAGQTLLTPHAAPPDPCAEAATPQLRPIVDLLGKQDSDE